jgi:hypothetical protein
MKQNGSTKSTRSEQNKKIKPKAAHLLLAAPNLKKMKNSSLFKAKLTNRGRQCLRRLLVRGRYGTETVFKSPNPDENLGLILLC